MAFHIVPVIRRDFDFFDRQRDLFSDWLQFFDEDWRTMALDDSRSRFERELDRIRNNMFRMDIQPVKLDIESPFVTDPEGNRKLSLRFDCSQFKPEEIHLKTKDNHLTVHAKHVEEREGRKIHKEFTREYTLPENVDPKQLKSHLTSDGVLYIEAPAPEAVEAPKEHLIPIERLHKDDEDKPSDDKADEKGDDKQDNTDENADDKQDKADEKADENADDGKEATGEESGKEEPEEETEVKEEAKEETEVKEEAKEEEKAES